VYTTFQAPCRGNSISGKNALTSSQFQGYNAPNLHFSWDSAPGPSARTHNIDAWSGDISLYASHACLWRVHLEQYHFSKRPGAPCGCATEQVNVCVCAGLACCRLVWTAALSVTTAQMRRYISETLPHGKRPQNVGAQTTI